MVTLYNKLDLMEEDVRGAAMNAWRAKMGPIDSALTGTAVISLARSRTGWPRMTSGANNGEP